MTYILKLHITIIQINSFWSSDNKEMFGKLKLDEKSIAELNAKPGG